MPNSRRSWVRAIGHVTCVKIMTVVQGGLILSWISTRVRLKTSLGVGRNICGGQESLAYVRDQLGHSSIQVTVDVYGHLIPGANRAAVDRLDAAPIRNPGATEALETIEQSDRK
jgi:hypothetical protein